MNLHPETDEFLLVANIYNNKKLTFELQHILKKETLKSKYLVQTISGLGFLIPIMGFTLLPFTKDIHPILNIALVISLIMTLVYLAQYFLISKKEISTESVHKEHWHTVQNFLSDNKIVKIIEDCLRLEIISNKQSENIIARKDISDIQKMYLNLRTLKLKSTPLESTTISLEEHKKEFIKQD